MDEPATKKRKIDEDSMEDDDFIRKEISKMAVSESNLSPVLGDSLVSECSRIDVYIGKFIEKSKIGKVVVCLKEILPIPDLQHLKRVRNMEILLCPSIIDEKILKKELEEKGFDWSNNLEDEIKIISVVSEPPLTKSQHEVAHKLWPCNFHANKYIESLVSGNFFSKNEINTHRKYMEIAYEAGLIENTKDLRDIKGVVIVDPKINSIVAIGYDRRISNPCQHQIMIAIDNVAKTQNGGSWFEESYLNSSGLDHRGIPDVFQDMIKKKYPEIKTGARTYRKKGETNPDDPTDDCGPYLCTDYYVYTTIEPCAMCAMGLVHARAKKVFFAMANTNSGVLGSKCKLHTLSALNHRYEVFTGFF